MTDSQNPLTDRQSPKLKIVRIDKLLPHEQHDEQRTKPLMRRLPEDGYLLNPPVVASVSSDETVDYYVILDGANRINALQALNYEHVLVQIVDYQYPDINLLTWYHVVSNISEHKLTSSFSDIEQIEQAKTDIFHARALLAQRTILAFYILADGSVTTLAGGGLDLHERTNLLSEIVSTYLNEAQLNRTSTDEIDELKQLFPDMTAAIVFPKYDPVEILDLAQYGLMLPPGITRHVVNGRTLRLSYPLDELSAEVSLEEKNKRLSRWINKKYETRSVRYYAESTYLFDE